MLLQCYHYFVCFRESKLADTYFDRDVEQAFMTASKTVFQQKTLPYLLIAKRVGNMYTPSLYGGLCSYLIRFVICHNSHLLSTE